MDTYFIPIDATTIRRNPEYHPPGITHYQAGTTEVTFHGKGPVPKEIEESEYFEVTECSQEEYCGLLYYDKAAHVKIIEKIRHILEKYNIELDFTREIIDTTQINSPEFLYEYQDTKVKCETCESIFSHKYLRSEWTYDGGGHSDTICPVCGDWDCCNIEYETLEKALKRIDKTKEEIN